MSLQEVVSSTIAFGVRISAVSSSIRFFYTICWIAKHGYPWIHPMHHHSEQIAEQLQIQNPNPNVILIQKRGSPSGIFFFFFFFWVAVAERE